MHSTKLFNKFFYAVTIVAFIFQLIMPTTVYADGEDPTPEPAPTSIPVEETTPAPTEEVTPLPTDLVIPEGTDLVVLDENGQVLPLATQAAAEVIVLGDPIWCPVGATPVALTNGCTDSYTSLTALLAAADESLWGNGVIWIEDGAITEAGAVSLNGASNTNSLTINGGWTGGTTLDAATPSTFVKPITIFWGGALTINNISLNGATAGNVEAMLNVQAVGDVTLSNVTVTNSQGTTGTVNADAEVSFATGEAGYGAKINTTAGGVTVSNSTFTYNNHNGLYVISKGPVTLTTITAYGNGGQRDLTGPEKAAVEAAHHTGQSPDSLANWDVTDPNNKHIIDDVTYYNHVWWGSGVQVSADTGNVSVSNSTFGDTTLAKANKDSGLVVNASAGNITLTDVTSYGNFGYGADLFASAGNILVEESDFLNTLIYKMGDAGTGGDLLGWWDHANYWNNGTLKADWKWQGSGAGGIGLSAYGSGDITLNKIHAGLKTIGNQYSGANLASYNGQISVTDSEFIENGISGSVYGGGLFADSGLNWQTGALSCVVSGGCDITLTNVTVNENYGSGAEIFAYGGGVTVQGTSTFNLNESSTGLYVKAGNGATGYCPTGSVCDITITGAEAKGNISGDGLYLYSYFGNIVVDNVTATENNDAGANLGNEYGGNVTVSNSHFNSNSAGVYVETGQDEACNSGFTCNITLTNIEGNDNSGYGAELYNDASGNISVSNSFFNSNSRTGLNATSSYYGCDSGPCNVTITNIIANDNDWGGADLNTNYGGSITVNGGTFNGNKWDGLYLATAWENCLPGMVCDVTVNGVTAQNNGGEGANLGTEMGGKITVNGGTFTNNESLGLSAEINEDNETNLSGAVKFDSVTSTGNGASGASITLYKNGGTVEVTNSVFNLNKYHGLYVASYSLGTAAIPEIFLNGVTASQNAAKGFFYNGPAPVLEGSFAPRAQDIPTPANILICSSIFEGNTSYGIYVMNDGGLTEVGPEVISSGNNLLGVDGLENQISPAETPANCVQVPEAPARQVFHGNEDPNIFSCDTNELPMMVLLPNTDWVRIPCNNGKVAQVYALPQGSLAHIPGTFISALSFTIQNAIGSNATIGFKIPNGAAVESLSIVHWNSATQSWDTVGGSENGSGYFVAQVHQNGIYALIQK